MQKIKRSTIHLISRYSNWSEENVDEVLRTHVYSDASQWQQFLKIFFLGLGVCFTTAGIVFFFAYNWDDLHKFFKIAIVQSILTLAVLSSVFLKLSSTVKNAILTGASVLVGILFAVFGQVYQTGADAFDLFLSWAILISTWVILANFSPLWLFFIALINVTWQLYFSQISDYQSIIDSAIVSLLINLLFLLLFLVGPHFSKHLLRPEWFTRLLTILVIYCCTVFLIIAIYIFMHSEDSYTKIITQEATYLWLPTIAVVALYISGIMYGWMTRSIFHIALIALSTIIIIAAYLLNLSTESYMFATVSIFIIISITLIIHLLLNLQKQWKS